MTKIKINEIDVMYVALNSNSVVVVKPTDPKVQITHEEAQYLLEGFKSVGLERVIIAPGLDLTVVDQTDV